MTIEAQVVAHSRPSWAEDDTFDLFTMQLKYPRFIHSEFMTHRVFSRNASSSRAIPAGTMLTNITSDPAMPVYWGKNRKGMQAEEEFGPEDIDSLKRTWLMGLKDAVETTSVLMSKDLHKQLANRILEPWAHINVVVTATEWKNFFQLRCHKAAQPEIHELADKIREAQARSKPQVMAPDTAEDPISVASQWHKPYVRPEEGWRCTDTRRKELMLSAARCARVSYLRHNGTIAPHTEDFDLHDRLLHMGHMSPFEHQAKPMPNEEGWDAVHNTFWPPGVTHKDRDGDAWSGNLRGWIQYRQLLQ